MAKKSFNISSTLSKNKLEKEPTPELAKKIPLPKKPKDVEELKEKVEAVHAGNSNPTPVVTKVPEQPKVVKPRKKTVTQLKEEQPEKLVRLTIDTPEVMHKRLKIKSIEMGISMRDYILRLIEKDLAKK